MARNNCVSVCRLCRREHMKLFLKGSRCYTPKCAVERREYAPGMHGQARAKISDYGLQLREKQKVKRIYGLREQQFKFYFRKASHAKGVTGAALLTALERRLDNVLYRMGAIRSRAEARQLVCHGHVTVNERLVNAPSFQVRAGDEVLLKGSEKMREHYKENFEATKDEKKADWLEVDPVHLKAKVKRMPERQDVQMPIQEQLIVELYSK